ncbi:MAG: HAD family hydrolase [Oscillospiraceae bacterium]|nr:HAD family hydrolase [Oscillospiraceae bacterium]
MKQAVIFDLDGTMWDSCEEVLYAWNAVLTREFPDSPLTMARLKQCMGKIKCDIARMIVPTDDEEERSRIIDACFDYELEWVAAHPGTLYEGVRETLRMLRETYTLCIVSNCEDGYVQAFLDGCGMRDLFEDFEMAGRTGLSKGENIRLVMARNGITAAVYVGDTTGDEAAARFAGLPFIHAAYGFGTADAPDAVIHSLCELPGILNQYL